MVPYEIFALQKVEEEQIQGTETHLLTCNVTILQVFSSLSNFLVPAVDNVTSSNTEAKADKNYHLEKHNNS